MLEVAAEASLQAFLQLYVILTSPVFFNFDYQYVGMMDSVLQQEFDFKIQRLILLPQFIPCLSSIAAIPITYTADYDRRWMGKVAFGGKALYFVTILSAVTSRLMMFELFSMALIKDKKPFSLIYVMFAIHIIITVSYTHLTLPTIYSV